MMSTTAQKLMKRLIRHAAPFVVPLFCLGTPQLAQAALQSDFGNWNSIELKKDLNQDWSLSLENHLRLQQNLSEIDQILIKPLLSYHLSEMTQIGLGYAWAPEFNPYQNENRIWQQALWQSHGGQGPVSARSRLEERFLQNQGLSYRIRQQVEVKFPLNAKNSLSFALSEELLLNANSVSPSHSLGVDQNRLFLGFVIQPSRTVQWQIGALNVYSRAAEPEADTISENLQIALTLKL